MHSTVNLYCIFIKLWLVMMTSKHAPTTEKHCCVFKDNFVSITHQKHRTSTSCLHDNSAGKENLHSDDQTKQSDFLVFGKQC